MTCVISVKGGPGGHGKPIRDRTGPVSEFLVDNTYFYRAVRQHVEKCDKCDPLEIIKVYLERRKSRSRFEGQTSGLLVELAFKYERILHKRGVRVPQDLVNEFIWRSGDYKVLLAHQSRLSSRQMYDAVKLMSKSDKVGIEYPIEQLAKGSSKYAFVISLLKGQTSDEEIDRILCVADVMIS